ncbi:ABC transporter substrate-binding protein [Nostoc sphaeroides]|uniref:LivK, branched-chain amino acid transport system substrate-binding protein n=1 Tax=Nostoc sphaeroides CCNUC1 TaxID=2653204 RepID=A0A5P8W775_9NOSO|nr:ABC transporter substrate-binding protein [Nostoc sphaeroides]QFS48578.1 livK, branched-chain amino acid transport system substrate-binding protein [Nostoc sphaeroides CCNUC1]
MADSKRNPYIIGTPVEIPEKLFGRETIFKDIEDSLQQNAQFILLYGQRRIGKSSVLKNIPLVVSKDEFFFVHCDLQTHIHASLGEILYAIFSEIFRLLNLDITKLDILLSIDVDIRAIINNRVLPLVYDALDNKKLKKLVLLLDEFDVVTQNDTEQASDFLRFLENLVRRHEELFVIAVVGRYLNANPDLLQSNALQSLRVAPFRVIGLLDNKSAERLIIEPANNVLKYQLRAIEEIIKYSSGHPFYTQILCYEIFNLAMREGYSVVIPAFVSDVLDQAIESAEGGLGGFWDGLSISEKVVISAVAEAQKQNKLEDPLKLLESYGFVLTDSLEEAIQLLINKGFLDNNPIKLKVELVRHWVLKRHQLRDEIWSLETLETKNVESVLNLARSLWQENRQENALSFYEQVLQLNPNHFSTVVELAEKYLYLEKFDKALELYDRAYKVDPVNYQQELIQALDQFGHRLITERNFTKAKQQYEKILLIEPASSLAQQKLLEIKAFQGKRKNIIADMPRQVVRLPISRLSISLLILALIGIAGSLFAGRIFNNCPAGQEKSLGITCIDTITVNPDSKVRISRGDRTLFTEIKNSDRDQGIDSFNNKNYIDAEKYFKQAVNTNPNDPEVLIYQNNARAIKQGNPLTLATVVPATNRADLAQEILRGIAQAQNQFNEQGGLNGRLLEIIIADDANQEKTARVVAEELVKQKSILGVIGHSSSHVTKAALNIYETAKLAVISSTSSSTTLQSSVFFRTVDSDEETGKDLAEYALKLKLKKAVIFCNPNDPYSNSIREEFRNQFERVNGQIAGKPCINLAAPTFNEDKIKNLLYLYQPQAMLLFPDTQHLPAAITIAKAHKEWLGMQTPQQKQEVKLLGGASLYSNQILQEGGDAVEGLVVAVPWFRDAPKSKSFAQKAENQWKAPISWNTATSFDATQIFIESFKQYLPPSKATVLGSLPNVRLSSNNTSGEDLMFDKNSREIKRKYILIIVKSGKFVVLREPNLEKINNSNVK